MIIQGMPLRGYEVGAHPMIRLQQDENRGTALKEGEMRA